VTLRLWYAGIPVDLVADSDTVDGGPGWEEYVHGHACWLIAKQQEESTSEWAEMMDRGRAEIMEQMPRDRSTSRQVRDRRGMRPETRERRDRWRFPWLP
jgi:hypothetical protein